jgi:catechol 2,3-dioxygenase-like lactoylglutathione lyase family enzyme
MPQRKSPLTLDLRRVILFSPDVPALAHWYQEVFGLRIVELAADDGWAELDGGGCHLALHGGGSRRTRDCGHKLVFGARSVAATRRALVARGAKLGPVRRFGKLHLCDGRDPDGNVLQISNRP